MGYQPPTLLGSRLRPLSPYPVCLSRSPSQCRFHNCFLFCRRYRFRTPVAIANLLYIVARLSVWGHSATKLHHRTFTRVITCKHKLNASIELIEQLLQVTGAPRDVLCRIRRMPNRALVPGINCMRPRAPFGERARGLKCDSCSITQKIKYGSTPYFEPL